jgi:hypothetical protein
MFVGISPYNRQQWEDSVMEFNAALGMELRGDLHMVIIKDSALPEDISPDDYINALKAYWINELGKDAIAKNTILVVLGLSDNLQAVEWARADTGMPIGNGIMLAKLELQLTGANFNLDTIMGDTYAEVRGATPFYTYGQGIIPQVIMVEAPFERVCMTCQDEGEEHMQGFDYIVIDVSVGFWGYVLIIFVQLLLSGVLWAFFVKACYEARYQSDLYGGYGYHSYDWGIRRRYY